MAFKIREEKNVIDDHLLDIIGQEFKFDHVKGLAEWLKNSSDAYTREEIPDDESFMILRLWQKSDSQPARFECLDFVGMTAEDVDKAFKRWGDPKAAARGKAVKTLGGHGNGGKFYMRQMFKTSSFATFRDGKLNVFGFNERKRYGYAEGMKDKATRLADALEFAGVKGVDIPRSARERWARTKDEGFTLVCGESPEQYKGWKTVEQILQRLRIHPQSRRIVRHKQVLVSVDGAEMKRLLPEEISPREGFEGPFQLELPELIERDGQKFAFRNSKYPKAQLTLYTAAQPFARVGEQAAMNSVDILGEVGCIGSYRMHELGYPRNSAESEFVYGECYCPILEDPGEDCVKNDREKLVDNDRTAALLAWILEKVDELCDKMAEKEKKERRQAELQQSSAFNELLNRWKNKFMEKVFAQVFGGPAIGEAFGGLGSSDGEFDRGKKSRKEKHSHGNDGGMGDTPGKAPRFPRVLLSGHDADPLHPEGGPLDLPPRQPPVYQRHEDVKEGIYWINTARPLAQRIVNQYGADSPRWREYLFQRYVDIILKEGIYRLAKRDPELTPDKIDGLINDVTSMVHDAAAVDLETFLFEEAFLGAKAERSKE